MFIYVYVYAYVCFIFTHTHIHFFSSSNRPADPGGAQEYMDPMNEHNALNEAKQMIAVADENQNNNLELDEILKYSEYFTGSKLMDYARNVHEEF